MMVEIATKSPLPRSVIADFAPNRRAIAAFEDLQEDAMATGNFVIGAQTTRFLTIAASAIIPGASVLETGAGLVSTDGGEGQPYILRLADTAVTPGSYGTAAAWPSFTADQQGRLIAAASLAFTVAAPVAYDPVARIFSLTPVPVALAGVPAGGTAGQMLTKTGAADYAMAWGGVRELACSAEAPIPAGKVLVRYVARTALTIPANLSGWAVAVSANPAAAFVVSVVKNAATIGSISISTAGIVSLATTGGTTQALATGDVLTLVAPAAADASIAGLAITGQLLF